jgi:hypothetical protein
MASTNNGTHADATNHSTSNSSGPNEQIVGKGGERQETQLLLVWEKRLEELKQVLNDVCKENSLLKMKSVVMLGTMRLEIDSLREDRNFLIEKYHDLKRQNEEFINDRIAEEQELMVIATRKQRTYSI